MLNMNTVHYLYCYFPYHVRCCCSRRCICVLQRIRCFHRKLRLLMTSSQRAGTVVATRIWGEGSATRIISHITRSFAPPLQNTKVVKLKNTYFKRPVTNIMCTNHCFPTQEIQTKCACILNKAASLASSCPCF